MDTSALIFKCMDQPDWVHRLLGVLLAKKLRFIESMKGAKFDLIETGGGAASSTVISPALHEEFCLAYDRPLHDALHDLGFMVTYHTCGGTLGIEEMIVANGCDVSETCAPPSVGGNQEPWEFAAKISGRVALIGGVDQFNVITTGSRERIRAAVHRLFETVGRHGGYVCALSDHFFETPVENLRIFAEAVLRMRVLSRRAAAIPAVWTAASRAPPSACRHASSTRPPIAVIRPSFRGTPRRSPARRADNSGLECPPTSRPAALVRQTPA